MFDPKIRILVVDDMMTMRKIVTKALKEMGFTDFVEAGDGAKGWEALNQAGPAIQLVISDWNMPNSTGMDLLKRVRGDGRFKNLPFILLTAESEASQVSEAVQVGVSGYMVKPFTLESLKEKIQAVHKRHAA